MKGRSSGQRRDTGKRNETGGVGFARGHGGEWREVIGWERVGDENRRDEVAKNREDENWEKELKARTMETCRNL